MISMNRPPTQKRPLAEGRSALSVPSLTEQYQESLQSMGENPSSVWPLPLFSQWPTLFFDGLSIMTRSYTSMLQAWGASISNRTEEERVGLSENDREIVISAELPGFQDSEVEALVREGRLIIKGERHDTMSDDDQFHLSYRRIVPLPSGFPLEEAKTSYHDGVLEMHIPKPEQAKEASELGLPHQAESEQSPAPDEAASEQVHSERKSETESAKPKRSKAQPRRQKASGQARSKGKNGRGHSGRSTSKQTRRTRQRA